jgi:hypothetical protein
MTAQTVGQIFTATRAKIGTVSQQIGAELILAEAPIACRAFRDGVVPAVPEEQNAFFPAQVVRSLAVEMEDESPG